MNDNMRQTLDRINHDDLLSSINEIKQDFKIFKKYLEKDCKNNINKKEFVEKMIPIMESIKENIKIYTVRKNRMGLIAEKSTEEKTTMTIDNLIYDHCIQMNLLDTASHIQDECSDMDFALTSKTQIYQTLNRIKDDIGRSSFSSAMQWCAINRPRLKSIGSKLEANIRIQEFLGICSQGKYEIAEKFFKKILIPLFPNAPPVIRSLSLVLVMKQNDSNQFFNEKEKLQEVIDNFETDFLTIKSSNKNFNLSNLFFQGMCQHKTKTCSPMKSTNCPSCSVLFQESSKSLRIPHREISMPRCYISDEVLKRETISFYLPNGELISEKELHNNISSKTGLYVCPQTGKRYPVDQAKRAFFCN
eukprot:GHVP01037565.1.p1 GENE.GHVP01037565.1~~GHVP01037565.1.p1  ORF type:complete len:360 (+),score=53.00 GHVP01037565.1:262-1341(+)